jgi:DNA-directed RNA polymerase I subunit RPA2
MPTIDNIELQKCKKLDIANALHIASDAHLNSFNYFLKHGLQAICENMNPMEIFSQQIKDNIRGAENKPIPFDNMKLWFEDIVVGLPTKSLEATRSELKIFPFESRLTAETYEAPLLGTIARIVDGGQVEKRKINLGTIPVMVKSNACNLGGMTPKELVLNNEDCTEQGGYFIVNGLDKLLRMIVVPRRNYPFAIKRPTYQARKKNFTSNAVSMKCIREDLFSQTINMHYCYDGNIYLNIMIRKVEYLIPAIIVIKALVEMSDRELYNTIVRGFKDNSFISERVEVLLNETKKRSLHTKDQCLEYLGFVLKGIIDVTNPNLTNSDIGQIFLKEYIMIHCDDNAQKVNSLILMLQKLYSLVNGTIEPDNLDSTANHEILLSGHFYMMFFREKVDEILQGVKGRIIREITKGKEIIRTKDFDYTVRAIET